MGSIYQRKVGRWAGKYKDVRGTWRYVNRKSKADARVALGEAIRDRDEGISPVRVTVVEFLD